MEEIRHHVIDGKVVLQMRDHVWDTPEQLLNSGLAREVLSMAVEELQGGGSRLLEVFGKREPSAGDLDQMLITLRYLARLKAGDVISVVPGSQPFFRDELLFNDFVEFLYNYWRSLQRLIICDSEGSSFDQRPYRTFNQTVETLTRLVRSTYRDIQENITGTHPRIYRQVPAGSQIATIALPEELVLPDGAYDRLRPIPLIRQVLIYPPLIFDTPTNKRTGHFDPVQRNPLEAFSGDRNEWLCYPAKVGSLVILVYFNLRYFELGFALANLFELASDEDLRQKPNGVFVYGVPGLDWKGAAGYRTIFYDDQANGMLVGATPEDDEFAYFGYLKKMILTLHNIQIMKRGLMPFHGALFSLQVRGRAPFNVLMMGDTGAGKSETIEAMRSLSGSGFEDLVIIADDMGSLQIGPDGELLGFGSETGAFVRLDDLQPGYAFGQIDRAILMNANQVNARVVLPVVPYHEIIRPHAIDMLLYANNYEPVDAEHPVLERFASPDAALEVFRRGRAMSKGTTTSTGITESYFANIFGPLQYKDLHEGIAQRYFGSAFAHGTYVGQVRTMLGVSGQEKEGPLGAARALIALFGQPA
jgi:hypothetical protein